MKSTYTYLILLLLFVSVLSASAQTPTSIVFYQDVNWSPNGKHISFTKMEMTMEGKKRKMKSDVFFVLKDGTGLKRVTDDKMNAFYSGWSGNGKKIVFSVSDMATKTADIYVIEKDGKGLKQITRSSGRNSAPAFSPDGKRLAFISTRDGDKMQIYIMDIDGSNQKRLTTDSKIAYYSPQWSLDSKKITYYSEIGDKKDQIWTMDADGGNPKLLTNNIGHNFYPSFTPDGKVVFISTRDGERGVYTVDSDGSNLKIIKGLKASFVRFSPDGKKIAYVAGKSPTTDIYVANSDGTGSMKLLNSN